MLPNVGAPALDFRPATSVEPGRRFANPKVAQAVMFARELLATAELGLADAQSSDPRRWTSGLYVAIVFGRSVTFALQNGQSEDQAFEEWYLGWQQQMKKDARMSYMDRLRVSIVHQVGPPARRQGTRITYDDVPGLEGVSLEAPWGGALNWTVRPVIRFDDSPFDEPADFLIRTYLDYLTRIVEDAERRFSRPI